MKLEHSEQLLTRALQWYVAMRFTNKTKKVIALRAIALNLKNVCHSKGFTLVCYNDVYLQKLNNL